jgi:hypothetical protein
MSESMMNVESTGRWNDEDKKIYKDLKFHLVIDGSFCQPLESTRLTRTSNVRNSKHVFICLFEILF